MTSPLTRRTKNVSFAFHQLDEESEDNLWPSQISSVVPVEELYLKAKFDFVHIEMLVYVQNRFPKSDWSVTVFPTFSHFHFLVYYFVDCLMEFFQSLLGKENHCKP